MPVPLLVLLRQIYPDNRPQSPQSAHGLATETLKVPGSVFQILYRKCFSLFIVFFFNFRWGWIAVFLNCFQSFAVVFLQSPQREDAMYKALVKRRVIVDNSWFSPYYHQLSPTIVHMVKRPKKIVIVDDSSPAVVQAKSRERRVPSSFRVKIWILNGVP